MATPELSAGKTIFVIATVAGCLAILWPRVFQPMSETAFTMTKPKMDEHPLPIETPTRHPSVCCDVVYSYDINNQFFARLCEILVPSSEVPIPIGRKGATKPRTEEKPPPGVIQMCRDKVLELCGTDISHFLKEDPTGPKYQKALEELHAQNVTHCLRSHYEKHDKHRHLMEKMRRDSKESVGKHMRQERSPHLHPALMHPAMRERGVPIAPRMHEHYGEKPKPVPPPMMGVRPPPGVRGKIPTPSPTKAQTGSMGFVMPMYTVGIVVFFIYTVMKFWKMFWKNIQSLVVLFKRSDNKAPQVMDFHMDPEYHKYVLNEEVSTSRPYYQRKELEELNSKHSPADDDRKLEKPPAAELTDMFTAIEGIIAEMDEYRERLKAGPSESVAGATEEDSVDHGFVDVTQQAEVSPAPATQESPSVVNSEQLRDSVQSPKALDDSDLLSLIPEDTRMAVVGMETRPLFDEVPAEEPSENLQETPLVPCNSKNSSPDINSYEMVAKMAVSTKRDVSPPNSLPSSSFVVINATSDADKASSSVATPSDDGFKLISPDDIHIVNMILDDSIETLDSPISPERDSSFENIQLLEGEDKLNKTCDVEEPIASVLENKEVQPVVVKHDLSEVNKGSEEPPEAGTSIPPIHQKQSEQKLGTIQQASDKQSSDVCQEPATYSEQTEKVSNVQLAVHQESIQPSKPVDVAVHQESIQPSKPVEVAVHQETIQPSKPVEVAVHQESIQLSKPVEVAVHQESIQPSKPVEVAVHQESIQPSKPVEVGPSRLPEQQKYNVHEVQNPLTVSSKEIVKQTVVIDKDESSEEEEEDEEEEEEDTEEEESEEEEEEITVLDKRPKPQPPPPPPPCRDLSHVQSGKSD